MQPHQLQLNEYLFEHLLLNSVKKKFLLKKWNSDFGVFSSISISTGHSDVKE